MVIKPARSSNRRRAFALERITGVSFGLGALCWALLWAGINTGSWNLDLDYITSGWIGAFNGIRAAFPIAMIVVWVFCLLGGRTAPRKLALPEALWLWYGSLCLLSSLYVEPWFLYGYWGLAYFGGFAALYIYLRGGAPLPRIVELNRLSWILCSVVLVILVYFARGHLLEQTSMGLSGYDISTRMPTIAGMPMVRATGISRMAAVPAIVAFVAMWENEAFYPRLAWGALFAACFWLIWVMQARGTLASIAAALALVMVLLGGRARTLGWSLLALVALFYISGYVSHDTIHYVRVYATRGQKGQDLASMSGRVGIYQRAWRRILESPYIGYGPQADRMFKEVGNAQNGVLYALLCGGFIGGAGYIGGIVVAWLMLIRAIPYRKRMTTAHRTFFLQAVGIMTFFTIRSYPENCAALYSVDLLLQLPALVYFCQLYRILSHSSYPRKRWALKLTA